MSQQYNLYNILFEEASKKPDLKARVQAMKAARDSATGPTSKIDTARGMSIPDLVQSGQKELKTKVEKLSKVANAIKPSENDMQQAKEAAKEVSTDVTAISQILYPETSKESSKPATKSVEQSSEPVSVTAKTEPQNVGTAHTLPRTPAKTVPMPQDQLLGAIQAGGVPRSGPTSPTASPSSRTETLPAAQQSGFMNRLKRMFKETVEEAIELPQDILDRILAQKDEESTEKKKPVERSSKDRFSDVIEFKPGEIESLLRK